MFKINIDEVPEEGINRSYKPGVAIWFLILEEFGAPNFEMRYFELEKGCVTSLDLHDHEHEVFVLRGRGAVMIEGVEHELRPNDAILIEGNEQHQLRQTGDEPFGFLCIVKNGVSSRKKGIDLSYGKRWKKGLS
jgi:quercetin dioxygenase-like cupin family protein